ncbi:hypothetical protein CY34DRAFT_810575 [Suillus luteus UH-Slu-Lm8-n1]|uniref:Uncharacterized protein n=1 Tax=Suillus luteus UH-Slu-Lm8-n1 TaxID=930992 RepID=A0A0D0A6F4_9AGAM|nr:hypothetical protein CY34DRAFT_810575 [Suillus luteus UH-Slu-Lm8-n1]
MVETISSEILCAMTGEITWSTFGHTSKFLPMRSVYIAGIKYTTASSGAMFCPPIAHFCGQFFSGLTSGLQPRQDMWMSLSVPCLRVAAVQEFSRRPLNDGGVPRCSLQSMTPGSIPGSRYGGKAPLRRYADVARLRLVLFSKQEGLLYLLVREVKSL